MKVTRTYYGLTLNEKWGDTEHSEHIHMALEIIQMCIIAARLVTI